MYSTWKEAIARMLLPIILSIVIAIIVWIVVNAMTKPLIQYYKYLGM